MKVVEVEGSHTVQNIYGTIDVHVGQSVAVLVTLNQQPKDYYIVASTRFTRKVLIATGVLHYSNSSCRATGTLPIGPTYQRHWSLQQARTLRFSSITVSTITIRFNGVAYLVINLWRLCCCRWNLTANAARPNPQGSYHYGKINVTRTLVLENSAPVMYGKQRYAVNRVSYVEPDTPLKLADHFNISGVFNFKAIQDFPTRGSAYFGSPVVSASLHDFYEIVFQNNENTIQSWHLDGYDFWVVA